MADDIQGLPDVDLNPILDQFKETQEQERQETQQEPGKDLDLAQFKNPKDLLKSYKEIQGAFTRVTQENKSSKEELSRLKEELEMVRYQAPVQQQQQLPDDSPMKQYQVMRIAEVLEEESEKNRPEFQDRYAYAQMVSREYPQLSTSARGVKKLFELGDKLRVEHLRKNAGKALESIFGEPLGEEEINRLRTLVKGDKAQVKTQNNINMNAYMPDTSASTRSGADQNQNPNAESLIKESVQKGDVDGVIDALFTRALAE